MRKFLESSDTALTEASFTNMATDDYRYVGLKINDGVVQATQPTTDEDAIKDMLKELINP